jgi:hypothetical protein
MNVIMFARRRRVKSNEASGLRPQGDIVVSSVIRQGKWVYFGPTLLYRPGLFHNLLEVGVGL